MIPLNQIDEEVRAKVIEAVPDILELKFGCRVVWRTIPGIYVGENFAGNDIVYMDFGRQAKITYGEFEEIIGRPITLSDVLIAIKKNIGLYDDTPCRPYPYDATLEEQEDVRIHNTAVERWMIMLKTWNLTKNYEDQSEATLRFIHSIICK
jgi:hypothetical protein